jgi:hypothetical protein
VNKQPGKPCDRTFERTFFRSTTALYFDMIVALPLWLLLKGFVGFVFLSLFKLSTNNLPC